MITALRFDNFTRLLEAEYGPQSGFEDLNEDFRNVMEAFGRQMHPPVQDPHGAVLMLFHDGSALLLDAEARTRFCGAPEDLMAADQETFELFKQLLNLVKENVK